MKGKVRERREEGGGLGEEVSGGTGSEVRGAVGDRLAELSYAVVGEWRRVVSTHIKISGYEGPLWSQIGPTIALIVHLVYCM